MRHMSTRTTFWLTTFSVLAGLTLVSESTSAAVISGKQEIRWFAPGPYQGNPDDPSVERPQTLQPTRTAEEVRIWTLRAWISVPLLGISLEVPLSGSSGRVTLWSRSTEDGR